MQPGPSAPRCALPTSLPNAKEDWFGRDFDDDDDDDNERHGNETTSHCDRNYIEEIILVASVLASLS